MLLVSGGHSQFVLVRGVGQYVRWGSTIDDALGEAFDKVAKLLGLGVPGGPEVERQALKGDALRFRFPRPLLREARLDFSFSGLKTAVRLAAEAIAPLSDTDVADICASFQAAVTEIVARRAADAMARFRAELPENAAELHRRRRRRGQSPDRRRPARRHDRMRWRASSSIRLRWRSAPITVRWSSWAGLERLALGATDGLDFTARPRWPLDEPAMAIHAA